MSKPEIASEPASLLEQVSSSVGFITLLMKLYNNRTLACRNVALNTGVPWIFMVLFGYISFEEFVENHDLEDMLMWAMILSIGKVARHCTSMNV